MQRKVITYIIEAEISQVASYYEVRMQEYGWMKQDTKEPIIYPRLTFVYRIGTDNKGKLRGGRAEIELTALDNGNTQAIVSITGYGLLKP